MTDIVFDIDSPIIYDPMISINIPYSSLSSSSMPAMASSMHSMTFFPSQSDPVEADSTGRKP